MPVEAPVGSSAGFAPATPASLLLRLRDRPRASDWNRFVDIYGPVIYGWARRKRLQAHDAADLMQEVLTSVVGTVGRWQSDQRRGPFRAWLCTVAKNKLCDYWRAAPRRVRGSGDPGVQQLLEQLEARDGVPEPDWDENYRGEVLGRVLRYLRPQFSERTWTVFERLVLDDARPEKVSAELGMTLNAVYVAKSRVIARLRAELEGLWD